MSSFRNETIAALSAGIVLTAGLVYFKPGAPTPPPEIIHVYVPMYDVKTCCCDACIHTDCDSPDGCGFDCNGMCPPDGRWHAPPLPFDASTPR